MHQKPLDRKARHSAINQLARPGCKVFIALLLMAPTALWCSGSAHSQSPDALIPTAGDVPVEFDLSKTTGSVSESGLVEPLVEESNLEYHDGPVQYEPKLFLIFWGKHWNEGSGATLKKELLKFYEGLKGSLYQRTLTQYDSPGGRVSESPTIEAIYEDGRVAAPSEVSEEAVENEAAEEWERTGEKENVNDQFVVLLPPGSTYSKSYDGDAGCGQHGSFGIDGTFDFVPYAGDPPFDEWRTTEENGEKRTYYPCTYYGAEKEEIGKYDPDRGTTGDASHEYAESVTDAERLTGWVRTPKAQQEIADVCSGKSDQQLPDGIWAVELWDNTKRGCVIADETPELQKIGPYVANPTKNERTTEIMPNLAQLVGEIEPCDFESHYFFEYGAKSYEKDTAERTLPAGKWGAQEAPGELTELAPNTEYSWRVAVKRGPITEHGPGHTFTTANYLVAKTKAATGVKATRAALNGTINPEDHEEVEYFFEYGTTESYGKATHEIHRVVSGYPTLEESEEIAGLATGTTYHFRIAEKDGSETRYGKDEVLTTHTSSVPFVESHIATELGKTKATMHGVVNPENAETKYDWEYGTSIPYGKKTSQVAIGSGTSNLEESKSLSGLEASTTYHYRIVATNSNGTAYGVDEFFSTNGKPTVEAKAATGLTSTGATLNGAVNPRNSSTNYYFEYGLTTSYGSRTAEGNAGFGNTSVEESSAITGLAAHTTYHYRLVATNAAYGTTEGEDKTFTTNEPEWYVKKSGAFKPLASPVHVELEASSVGVLDDVEGALFIGLTCTTKNWGHDTVEAGGLGKIEAFETSGSQCKGITEGTQRGLYACDANGIREMEELYLWWRTTLYKTGSEVRASIAKGGQEGTPSFEFTCENSVLGKFQATCGVNTSTHIANNTSAGIVEAEFEAKSAKTECGKEKETGEWKGTMKLVPTEAEKKAGVEAIKVE